MIFADKIKVRLEIKSAWIRGNPKFDKSVLRRARKGNRQTQGRQCGEGTEFGVMLLPATECRGTPWVAGSYKELESNRGMVTPSEPSRGSSPASTLISDSGLQHRERMKRSCFTLPGWR